MLTFSPGLFGGAGGVIGGTEGTSGVGVVGVEATMNYGWRERSHAEDDFFFTYPPRALGINAGYTFLTGAAAPAPAYLEAQYIADVLFGGALGWAWDPLRASQGPQITAFAGPVYARFTELLGDRGEITVGLFLKLPLYAWIWAK
jgi:hypothetical protein